MTRDETQQILRILKINYPQSFARYTDEETFEFLDLWAEAFKNDPVGLVIKAVKSIIYTDDRDFAPNIAQVKKQMFKFSGVSQKDVGEAWAIALRNCSCNPQIAKENYDKLPANIQKALGSHNRLIEIGWMDNDSVSFARKDFEKSYEVVLERERENVADGLLTYQQVERNNTLPAPKGPRILTIESKL